MTNKLTASAATAIAALCVAAPAASGSDQSIRDGIKAAEQTVQPDADAWAQSLKGFSQNSDPAPVRAATQKLVADFTNERKMLRGQKADTRQVRRGKVLYMVALKRMRNGLMSFDKALASIQSGKKSSVKPQLRKFIRRINAAEKAGTRAEKLIGVS